MTKEFTSTFQLSPLCFYLKKAFQLLPFCFLLYSCSFNKNEQGKGEAYLQGEWQQDSLPGQSKLLTYSLSDIKFTCDSFYITVSTVSHVDYGIDPCMNRGRWTEYIRGTYRQIEDTVQVKGFFYNADGTLKRENTCYRSGVFQDQYTVKQQSDSLLQFITSSSTIPMQLRLKKRTACTPKPL